MQTLSHKTPTKIYLWHLLV